MNDYTPSTDEVRAVWGGFLNYGGLTSAPSFLSTEEGYAVFDRWLESVRAEERARIARNIEAAESQHALNQALLPRMQAARIAREGA